MSWAGRRRAIYLGGVGFALVVLFGIPLFFIFYEAPLCSDGVQNGDELGVDCGGGCARLCTFQATDPVVLWSRSFEVRPGVYSAVAYVENPNPRAAATEATYAFRIFDTNNVLIAEREGRTLLMPGRITPIFEDNVGVGNRVPARTFLEFKDAVEWFSVSDQRTDLVIRNRTLSKPDVSPRLDTTLENTSITEFSDVEIIATIFGTDGNAVAASRTFLEYVPGRTSHDLVFTWPNPFPRRVESCIAPADIALLMDVSGSMNNDGVNPPQPLTDSINAAAAFIERLDTKDRVSIISFATESVLVMPLTIEHTGAEEQVRALSIPPQEEQGVTNIGDALIVATEELNSVRRNTSAQSVAVLLTDGRANAPQDPGGEVYARMQADNAKARGVEFYTVGLGAEVNQDFLREIAGSSDRAFQAVSSEELDRIYREISTAICERGPAVIDVIPKSLDLFSVGT
jgi:Mg-chelatase subunit ChlD